jgi:hypothetical protein
MGNPSFARRARLALFSGMAATLLLSTSAAAGAEPDEDSPPGKEDVDSQPERPAAKAAPAVAEAPAAAPAPVPVQPPLAVIEHMGPETYPGRLRGLYGGSMWLEPDFQGLQWPQNSRTGLGLSGTFWLDTGYEAIKRQSQQLPNTSLYFQQGRGVLRATPAYVNDGFFIQAQVELVGNVCQAANNVCLNTGTFTTDDLWIRIGRWNSWDLKVGRFEAWEIYHVGMAMDPYTLERLGAGMFGVTSLADPAFEAPTFYGVTYLHDRPTDGLAVGYAAVHLYPTDFLRFELLGKLGSDNFRADNSTGGTPTNYLGARPVAILDFGWLKFKVGAEYQKITPTTQNIQPGTPGMKVDAVAERKQKGLGATLQFVIDPIIEFGVSGAIGTQKDQNAFAQEVPQNSFTTTSVGGFVDFRLADLWLAGLGVNWTAQTDKFVAAGSTDNNFASQLQGFVALQYLLAGQLFIKGDFAYARAYFQPSDPAVPTWYNNMYTGRVRLLYLY